MMNNLCITFLTLLLILCSCSIPTNNKKIKNCLYNLDPQVDLMGSIKMEQKSIILESQSKEVNVFLLNQDSSLFSKMNNNIQYCEEYYHGINLPEGIYKVVYTINDHFTGEHEIKTEYIPNKVSGKIFSFLVSKEFKIKEPEKLTFQMPIISISWESNLKPNNQKIKKDFIEFTWSKYVPIKEPYEVPNSYYLIIYDKHYKQVFKSPAIKQTRFIWENLKGNIEEYNDKPLIKGEKYYYSVYVLFNENSSFDYGKSSLASFEIE